MKKSNYLLGTIGLVYFLVVLFHLSEVIEFESEQLCGISLFAAFIAFGDFLEVILNLFLEHKTKLRNFLTRLSYFLAVLFFILMPILPWHSSMNDTLDHISTTGTIFSFSFIFLSISLRDYKREKGFSYKGALIPLGMGIAYVIIAICSQMNIVSFDIQQLCGISAFAALIALGDVLELLWERPLYKSPTIAGKSMVNLFTMFLYIIAIFLLLFIPNVNSGNANRHYLFNFWYITGSLISFALIFISISLREGRQISDQSIELLENV